jgi:hypothetical protein
MPIWCNEQISLPSGNPSALGANEGAAVRKTSRLLVTTGMPMGVKEVSREKAIALIREQYSPWK